MITFLSMFIKLSNLIDQQIDEVMSTRLMIDFDRLK